MTRTQAWLGAFVFAAVGTLVGVGCGSDNGDTTGTNTNGDGGVGGDGSNSGGDGSVIPGDGATVDSPFGPCTPGLTQCTDCIDNDKDGLVDWQDPECTGPLDNDEGSFGTGIPGDNRDACKQDCFFDGNSGSGDDGCEWEVGCQRPNPNQASCPDLDLSSPSCTKQQPQKCLDYCLPRTPNGCDCFGCCAITLPDGGTTAVWLSSTCTVADVDNPAKCTKCQQNTQCINTCGHCELCVGKTQLPADCTPDAGTTTPDSSVPPTGQVCDNGQQICNATTLCPSGYYCVTGCCAPKIN